MVVKRFEIYFVDLEPTFGSEINKIRTRVIVSADEMNRSLHTVIVAPLTSTIRNYPSRINCLVGDKNGQIALDQLSAIDKKRLSKKFEDLDTKTAGSVLKTLLEMFK